MIMHNWTGFIPANPSIGDTFRPATLRPRHPAIGGTIVDREPIFAPQHIEVKELQIVVPKPILIEQKSTMIPRRHFEQPQSIVVDEVFRPVRK